MGDGRLLWSGVRHVRLVSHNNSRCVSLGLTVFMVVGQGVASRTHGQRQSLRGGGVLLLRLLPVLHRVCPHICPIRATLETAAALPGDVPFGLRGGAGHSVCDAVVWRGAGHPQRKRQRGVHAHCLHRGACSVPGASGVLRAVLRVQLSRPIQAEAGARV